MITIDLAGYIAKYRYFGDDSVDIAVEQGKEVGRPSLIFLKALSRGRENLEVNVGGRVILVARCEMVQDK